jgi:hypothetical protein
MRLATFALVAGLFNTNALNAYDYHCTLTDALSLTDDGKLEPHPLKETVMKTQAVVETETGKVFHPEFGNTFYRFIEVLDRGSTISAFKVVAYSEEGTRLDEGVGSFRNAVYFELRTYAEGPQKPFLAITNSFIAYGTCP